MFLELHFASGKYVRTMKHCVTAWSWGKPLLLSSKGLNIGAGDITTGSILIQHGAGVNPLLLSSKWLNTGAGDITTGSRNHTLITIWVCIGSVYNIVVATLRSTTQAVQGWQEVIVTCGKVARKWLGLSLHTNSYHNKHISCPNFQLPQGIPECSIKPNSCLPISSQSMCVAT